MTHIDRRLSSHAQRQVGIGLIFLPTAPFVLLWLLLREIWYMPSDYRATRDRWAQHEEEFAAIRAEISPRVTDPNKPYWDGTTVVYRHTKKVW